MKITNPLLSTMLLSATLLTSQAFAAARFDPERQPLGYIGPVELEKTDLRSGSKAYRGWFENGAWQGDLIEYNVSNKGALSTSIDLTTIQPKQSAGGKNWSAHVQFEANAADISHWDTGRKIITSTNGTNQVAFRWANLTNAQKLALDSTAAAAAAASSGILNFIRGDRSDEKPLGKYRLRFTVMGDVVHSNPEFAGAPEGEFSAASYVAFKNSKANRSKRVYVGANDGMLHAFNANNGNEVWAYIPSMLIPKLSKLAGTPYFHSYFVDGGITIQDAFFGGDWHTVLLGSLGAGGKGLYALDVTSPAMSSENLAAGNNKKILWELDGASDNDLGYIFDATTVTQLNDGKFYAIQGNGVSSINGGAILYLVELSTGTVTKLNTGTGSAGNPNGLAAPALVDVDSDGKADVAWAGDINGNMWKFDLKGNTSGSWKVAYKLYNGTSGQPITMAPDITNNPRGGHLVLFGTGRLYTDDDIKDKTVQSLFGIWDTGKAPDGTEKRLAQLLSGDTDYFGGGFSESVRTFKTTAAIDYNTYSGWKVDLPAGERLLTQPQLRAGRLKTTITNPNGFDNWLHEVTFDEGGVANGTIFDLNRDSVLDTDDRVDGNGDTDFKDLEDIPMGWQRPAGNMSQVTIASLGAGVDTLFLNFLNPPLVPPPCSGDCVGGLSGGHMDVDTDAGSDNGLGGATNGHVHEYDDMYNRTYVDYYDIAASKLSNVDSVGIAGDEKFIVLMANADLSPGAVLTINNKSYSVVEYQRIIHEALAKWDGAGPLIDPDGDSLIFTLDSLALTKAADPDAILLRNTFDNLAIISGGLHPTQASCVKNDNRITNGRWRNGSLIFHMVKASHFAGVKPGEALDRVTVQTPIDLKKVVVLSDGTQVELTEDLNGDDNIDGTSPAYEIFGGLTVKSNAEFLFESTLFWHFGELARQLLGVKPCYGDPLWAEAFKLETLGVSEEVYNDLLEAAGFDSFEELVTKIQSLEDCKDISEKKGGCKKEYKNLESLHHLGQLVENANNGGGGDGGDGSGGGGGISGDPIVYTDGQEGVSEGGVTLGPNYDTGRRTWIDILPE